MMVFRNLKEKEVENSVSSSDFSQSDSEADSELSEFIVRKTTKVKSMKYINVYILPN